ncbi:MAG: hypothetical protein ABR985_09360 [Methanotrichaceae archaeon]|jgi:hypothetical protein
MKPLVINPMLLELKMAKEIVAEIVHARPSKVEKIIQRRLEDMNRSGTDQPHLGKLRI